MKHRPPLIAWIGIAIIAVNLIMCLIGPWLTPYGEADLVGGVWEGPSAQFWFGTDNLGRDMLTRIIYGSRNTILMALLITCLCFLIGVTLGFIAAVAGGIVDMVLARLVDVMQALPVLIFALVVLSVLGTSIPVLIGTIAILESTRVFRVARAVGMNIAVMEYVEVAKLRGEGLGWIIRREILPNALAPLAADFGLRFCFVFLFIAALSFLGLGIQPPHADWGGMVRDNAPSINFGLTAPLFPAAAIALLSIGVNLVVDWLLSIEARPSGAQAEL
ncbi:ABC transporter permease [Methyloraptor flagellatus]|uniref:ABC transporter permease n=1 Tax=Methyloraptor flagellatus TaxID=3162530 RepID=A0AAU7XF72_9HYPH